MHLSIEGFSETGNEVARIFDSRGAHIGGSVELNDGTSAGGFLAQMTRDCGQSGTPSHPHNHVGVEPSGDNSRGCSCDLIESFCLVCKVSNRHNVGLNAEAALDLFGEAGAPRWGGPQSDFNETTFAGVAEQSRDARPRHMQVIGDGLHLDVLEVIHRRCGQHCFFAFHSSILARSCRCAAQFVIGPSWRNTLLNSGSSQTTHSRPRGNRQQKETPFS